VANTVNGPLDIVDIRAGRLLKQVPGQGGIRGIAYDAGSDCVFVGNADGGICNVFGGQSYELLKSIPLGDDADAIRHRPHVECQFAQMAQPRPEAFSPRCKPTYRRCRTP
jgi:hypothetical protein